MSVVKIQSGGGVRNKLASLASDSPIKVDAVDLSGCLKIRSYAFYKRTNLQSIEIPATVVSVGVSSFEGCSRLLNIDLTQGISSLGNYAFKDCTRLVAVLMPTSLVNIGTDVFVGCSALTEINYNGTISQWNSVIIDGDLSDHQITIHCTDGDIIVG